MKKGNRKERLTEGADIGGISLSGGPFALSIGQLLDKYHPGTEEKERTPSSRPARSEPGAPPQDASFSFRQAVLQKERAGRGGKTVTLVFVKPAASGAALENLAKTLRRALGCGAHVEKDRVVLQGDIADRAQTWFEKNGIKTVGWGSASKKESENRGGNGSGE